MLNQENLLLDVKDLPAVYIFILFEPSFLY